MQNQPGVKLALDSAIAQSKVWSQLNVQLIAESKQKNDFTFWLIFGGLSPNLGLSGTLSERLIQKVKWPECIDCLERRYLGLGMCAVIDIRSWRPWISILYNICYTQQLDSHIGTLSTLLGRVSPTAIKLRFNWCRSDTSRSNLICSLIHRSN